jgi:hypothetical protein
VSGRHTITRQAENNLRAEIVTASVVLSPEITDEQAALHDARKIVRILRIGLDTGRLETAMTALTLATHLVAMRGLPLADSAFAIACREAGPP